MKIEKLFFSYGDKLIFDNFSFHCDSPLIILKGPSGCGKTTLLKIVSGTIKGNLQFEKLSYEGKPYLILQDDALCPWLSGIDNIVKFIDVDIEYIQTIPLYVHSESFIEKKACNLSFGQRRMIELLRAIVFGPKMLLLDEPFNYLDSISRKIISESLLDLIHRNKSRILLASHFKEDFGELKARTYVFREDWPKKELIAQDE